MPHILVVEDEPQVRSALLRALADRGYATSWAATGMAALEQAVRDRPDLVLIDLGLPDVDGHDVLRMLRGVSTVPVIVATAREEESEIVRALDSGADDYLVKPFGANQLDARIRAVLRRTEAGSRAPQPVVVGPLTVDLAARVATVHGQTLDLTPREFDLLAYLAQRAGTVVTKRELMAEVWRAPYGAADKTVDVHLSWLRRKLGETADKPQFLHTVRGVGVRFGWAEPPTTGGDDSDAEAPLAGVDEVPPP
ncbi:MAG: response regulator transcription factor [Micromonosporaceae bacterium]|nr:response regulator transcription factor [Micromonosporaceae bacterium]